MDARQKEKIEKMLSLAFNNTSRDEATTAFSRAVALAHQSGTTLQSFRQGGSDKESELVDDYNRLVEKYNDLLRRALNVQDDRDRMREMLRRLDEHNDRLIARNRTLEVAAAQNEDRVDRVTRNAARIQMRVIWLSLFVGTWIGFGIALLAR